jgi:exosortase/archaeosortase family protein
VTVIRRSLLFFLIFACLQLGWQGLRGTDVEALIVHDATVRPAVSLINLLTPSAYARAVNFTISAPGGGLSIQNGCEGTEVLFLLLAALFVAPLSWRSRVTGIFVGTLVVFVVNQARIAILFYAYRADHALFDRLHGSVTPLLMILAVGGYFYGWLLHARPRTPTAA